MRRRSIDAGFAPASSFIDDAPRSFGDYAPGNAGGNSYGLVTLREALSRSLNIATVDLRRPDRHGARAVEYAMRIRPQSGRTPTRDYALALGSMTYGVSPVQLCGAYAALANGGVLIAPHLIRSIRDSEGRMVYLAQPNAHRAATDWAAYMITDMLKTAASSGSARALSSAGLPVAAKTGTRPIPTVPRATFGRLRIHLILQSRYGWALTSRPKRIASPPVRAEAAIRRGFARSCFQAFAIAFPVRISQSLLR